MLITIDHRLNAKALNLNANEASVLAAITKCTLMGKGWYADYEALADALEFVVSAKTVNRAVKKLINLGAVEKRQNVLYAKTNCPASETNCPQSGTNCPSPAPPIIKNNTSMKRNEIIAHANMRDAQPNPSSFEEFLSAYQAKAGKWQIPDAVLRECQNLWADCPDWKRKMLIARVQDGTWFKPRIDWTIGDFNPAPHNYNGDRSISTTDFENMIRTGQLVTAKWNGSWGKYTPDDVTAFALESYVPPTKEK